MQVATLKETMMGLSLTGRPSRDSLEAGMSFGDGVFDVAERNVNEAHWFVFLNVCPFLAQI